MDGLAAQAGGMMNSNQRRPLGLLSMGYFLKHLLPRYPSSDEQRSCQKEWRCQSWGLWQWADAIWGFHRHILSVHDQSDSTKWWCTLTRTVFCTCNQSVTMCWCIPAGEPQVHCRARHTCAIEVVLVEQTTSMRPCMFFLAVWLFVHTQADFWVCKTRALRKLLPGSTFSENSILLLKETRTFGLVDIKQKWTSLIKSR